MWVVETREQTLSQNLSMCKAHGSVRGAHGPEAVSFVFFIFHLIFIVDMSLGFGTEFLKIFFVYIFFIQLDS